MIFLTKKNLRSNEKKIKYHFFFVVPIQVKHAFFSLYLSKTWY